MSGTFHSVGHGPHTVLVLHGWFGDAHAFEPIEPWLSHEAYRYVFMNYRGYGGRRDESGAYTIDEIAADALALADTLGFETFSLIGHSMGGMAIERIATLAPDRVSALIAIAPVPCGGIRYDAATRQMLEAAATRAELRQAIIDRSTGGRLPASWVAWKAAYSAACSTPRSLCCVFARVGRYGFHGCDRRTPSRESPGGQARPDFQRGVDGANLSAPLSPGQC